MFVDQAIVKVAAGTGGSGASLLRALQVHAQGRSRRRRRRARRQRLRGGRSQPEHAARLPLPHRVEGGAGAARHGEEQDRRLHRRHRAAGAAGHGGEGHVHRRGPGRGHGGRPPAGGARRPRRARQRPLRHAPPTGRRASGSPAPKARNAKSSWCSSSSPTSAWWANRTPGKSTLLSVISAARPKIADYPFTTLEPNLGVVGLSGSRTFVVADIPGIIEGAHAGKGLGLRFLRHVERTRVLAYLLPLDAEDPQAVYEQLRREIAAYSEELAAKPHVVVLTKADLLADEASAPTLCRRRRRRDVHNFQRRRHRARGPEGVSLALRRGGAPRGGGRRAGVCRACRRREDAALFDPESADDGADDGT